MARDEIVPELEGIAGVADVEITGGLEDEVTITLDPVAVAQSGISPSRSRRRWLPAASRSRPASCRQTPSRSR